MKRFRDKRKVVSLTIVGLAYALIVTPLIINNIHKQQELRGRAQVANETPVAELSTSQQAQTAQAQCTASGQGEIGIAYTNTDASKSVVVTAVDEASSQSISLGTIAPGETKTSAFPVNKSTVTGGTVKFTVADEANPQQTQQVSAVYTNKTCVPAANAAAAKALTDVPATCGNVTTDVVLVIDQSGSMGQNNKLVQAKNAAKNFIDVVSKQESTTRISLVAFSTDSIISSPLTNDLASVKTKIDALTASGNTCHECGIKSANQEIASHGRAGVKKVVLLLTDGESNWISGGNAQVSASVGEQKGLAAVSAGFAQSKSVFFTIGFDIKSASAPQFLTQIANTTGGKYYFPAPNELDGVYQEISQLIGKGLIEGFVFNDSNINGAYDANEPKLQGFSIQATSSAATKTAVTDANGNYSIGGLCDGSYTVSQVKKTGWNQTMPANNASYPVTVTNASQITDKIFGNSDKARCEDGIDNDGNGFKDSEDSSCHTDGNPKNPSSYDPKKDGERGGGNTCADSKDNNGNGTIDGGDPVCHTDRNAQNPGTYDPNLPEDKTSIGVTVFLDGIGNRGDNTNPNDFSLSNKNPKHPTISADIQIFSLSNQLIASGTGSITYASASGNYLGNIPVDDGLKSGQFIMKVKADTHLRKQLAGIQTINSGLTSSLSAVALVAGDVNNDNQLNILDYNLLLDCYSDLSEPVNCTSPEKRVKSDLNDDDKVNQIDYNLFLREISTQPGQ